MKILALESSAKAASVCLTDDGRLVSQYYQNSGLTHSKTLLKMVEDMLHNMDISVSDIDMVAVAHGPGSFTGIRIGVAAAKGLAWGADLKMCGVSTLEAMAYGMMEFKDCVICPVMDARRGQVYNALFKVCDMGLVRLCPDRAISIQELCDQAEKDGVCYMLVGDGAEMCAEIFRQRGIAHKMVPHQLVMQSAYGVARAAEVKGPQEDIVPNYLRLSQAERERLKKLESEK